MKAQSYSIKRGLLRRLAYILIQKPTVRDKTIKSFFDGRVSPAACFVCRCENEAGYFVSKDHGGDPNREMLADGNGYGHVNVIAFSRPGDTV